jgi:hypothetical protein
MEWSGVRVRSTPLHTYWNSTPVDIQYWNSTGVEFHSIHSLLWAHVHILDKEAAKLATVEELGIIDFYTDGSVRNGRSGIGIWTVAWEVVRTIGRAKETNVHLTELEAIWIAIKGLAHENNRRVKIRVFSNSQSALRSI